MNLFRKAIGHLLSCKDVSHLLSQAEERPMTAWERQRVNWHLAVCRMCRAFERQMAFMRDHAALPVMSFDVMVNGALRTLDPAPATVGDLVRALNLAGKRIAVERNGEIVPKGRYDETPVGLADRFEIVAAVGGG